MPKVDEPISVVSNKIDYKTKERIARETVIRAYCKGQMRCQGPGKNYDGCCGQDDYPSLTIDHIAGDGARHRLILALRSRAKMNGKARNLLTDSSIRNGNNTFNTLSRATGSHSVVRDLLMRKIPPGYRILCQNCQQRVKIRQWITAGLETWEEYYQRCPEMRSANDAEGGTSNG